MLTWRLLQSVQNVKLVKGMYIWLFVVPITMKLFSRVSEETADLVIFGHSFEIALTLLFSWSLFYLSVLCFVIGNLFFRVTGGVGPRQLIEIA